MSDKGLHSWLKRQESGKVPPGLTADEQAELARYDRLWEAAAPPASTLEVDTNAAWAKLDDRLFGDEKIVALDAEASRQRTSRSRFSILRIAAALLVLAVAAFTIVGYLNEDRATVLAFSTTSDTEEVKLPDGSIITLNKDTELTYVADKNTRQLELTGEAFFDVARDEARPFTIITGDLTTTVLGTSFNIRAYPDEELEVSVKSGKVAVAAAEEEVVLVKAEKVTYEPKAKTLAPKATAVVEADVWKTQKMEFNGETIRESLPMLEAYFGKKFIAESHLLDCPNNVDLSGESLESAMAIMSVTLYLETTIQGDTIYIGGSGCQ